MLFISALSSTLSVSLAKELVFGNVCFTSYLRLIVIICQYNVLFLESGDDSGHFVLQLPVVMSNCRACSQMDIRPGSIALHPACDVYVQLWNLGPDRISHMNEYHYINNLKIWGRLGEVSPPCCQPPTG